ncbi:MAG: transcriptional repressor [Hydrogenothermaceae bacterium]
MQRRNTSQRKVIYDILKSTDTHPTADWVYERVRKYIPNISLGTVYRNLKVLKEKGYIIEISDGKQSRFDARTDYHFHFKCSVCNNVYDIEPLDINLHLDTSSLEKKGFKVSKYNIEFYGICKKCNKESEVEKDN